jgi:hypothetical protein
MALIDTFPSARMIVLMLPSFLRKPKLIQWLRILYVPLNVVHDGFKTYIDAQRKVLSWYMTRDGLERRLNAEFTDTIDGIAHVVTERDVSQLYVVGLDEEGGPLLMSALDEEDTTSLIQGWLDEEIGDGASLIVSLSPNFADFYSGQVHLIRKLIETYLAAGLKYKIEFLPIP